MAVGSNTYGLLLCPKGGNTMEKNERNPDWKPQKERIKEITDQLEAGIKELFESNKFKEYLKCMSKFHHYSLNNTLLIASQKPDAIICFNK